MGDFGFGGLPYNASSSTHELSSNNAPPINETILQGFEWHCPVDQRQWQRLAKVMPNLAQMGITSMWIPPACKAFSKDSTGYDIYDLFDLGEFDQKGAIHTKYGNRAELQHMVAAANAYGIKIIFDAIVNHKAGADYSETVQAVKVDPEDRRVEIGEPEEIEVWTGFNFAGRNGKYSLYKWNCTHFNGTDYNEKTKDSSAIWRFKDKEWADDVDTDLGNYDYLLLTNVDHHDKWAREEHLRWVSWISSQLKLGGIRLDAVKHISRRFVRDLILQAKHEFGSDFCILGDYWTPDAEILAGVIDHFDGQMALYDIPLLHNFKDMSISKKPDLRTIFQDSLVSLRPENALSFVATHDSQEGQVCEALVDPWFVPMAYSLILLRSNSGTPCVFYGDMYGSFGPKGDREAGTFEPPSLHWPISRMILARKLFAYGKQHDYLDEKSCIGFTREGHPKQSYGAGLAVLMTSSFDGASKKMFVGQNHGGERWVDLLRGTHEGIVIDGKGWAKFPVQPRKIAVYVNIAVADLVDGFTFDPDIYEIGV